MQACEVGSVGGSLCLLVLRLLLELGIQVLQRVYLVQHGIGDICQVTLIFVRASQDVVPDALVIQRFADQ